MYNNEKICSKHKKKNNLLNNEATEQFNCENIKVSKNKEISHLNCGKTRC